MLLSLMHLLSAPLRSRHGNCLRNLRTRHLSLTVFQKREVLECNGGSPDVDIARGVQYRQLHTADAVKLLVMSTTSNDA